EIGPLNGREARESGLRLKASVAPGAIHRHNLANGQMTTKGMVAAAVQIAEVSPSAFCAVWRRGSATKLSLGSFNVCPLGITVPALSDSRQQRRRVRPSFSDRSISPVLLGQLSLLVSTLEHPFPVRASDVPLGNGHPIGLSPQLPHSVDPQSQRLRIDPCGGQAGNGREASQQGIAQPPSCSRAFMGPIRRLVLVLTFKNIAQDLMIECGTV